MSQREILRAYRVPLDPTAAQDAALSAHAGAARAAFNYHLAAKVRAHRLWSECVAELTYTRYGHLPEGEALKAARADATRYYRMPNYAASIKAFFADPDYTWRTEVNRYAISAGMRNADTAWKNWVDSLKGERKGRRVGYPKFKRKGRSRDSFNLCHDVKRPTLRPDGYRRLKLPAKISVNGSIRVKGTLRRLARRIAKGLARVQSVTITRTGTGWVASILVRETVDIPSTPTPRQRQAGAIGIDLGVNHLAALSDGTLIENPRHLRHAEKRLKAAQRALSRTKWRLPSGELIDAPKRGQHVEPTQGRVEARARLARVHAEVAQRRAATLHALTKHLATSYATIAIEDLNVAGMSASARGTLEKPGKNVRAKAGLNRSLRDASFGEIRRQLDYKTTWYRSELALAGRYVPTTKMCSTCGAVKSKLPLSVRTYDCAHCGTRIDRDINAARNIAAVATPTTPTATHHHPQGVIKRPLREQPRKNSRAASH